MVKKIVFWVILIILLAVLGVFIWKTWGETPEIETGMVKFEEFEVKETSEGKLISHPETGFEVTIPADWEVVDGGNSVYCDSPDFEINKESGSILPLPKRGCILNFSIEESEDAYSTSQYIKGVIEMCENLPEKCDYEIIKINNEDAIKHISLVDNDNVSGEHIRVQISKNNSAFIIENYLFGEDKDDCRNQFEAILNSIKIGK